MSAERVITHRLISLPHACRIMKRLQQSKHSKKVGFKWSFELEELPGTYGRLRSLDVMYAIAEEFAKYKPDEKMFRLSVYRSSLKA